MADSVNNNNYSSYTNQTVKTNTTNKSNVDYWFDDPNKNDVSVDSFLKLMIAQLANQDFNKPVDDTQYLTQLAQFASMQQMQELAYFSKSNYVNSLLGKEVNAAKMSLGGTMQIVTGVIDKISLIDKQFTVFIGDNMFKLDQIMEIKQPKTEIEKPEKPGNGDNEETEEGKED